MSQSSLPQNSAALKEETPDGRKDAVQKTGSPRPGTPVNGPESQQENKTGGIHKEAGVLKAPAPVQTDPKAPVQKGTKEGAGAAAESHGKQPPVSSDVKTPPAQQSGKFNDDKQLKRRIRRIIAITSEGLVDRQDAVKSAVLATLCGMNTFFYGPPGTAKSRISRRLNDIFAGDGGYFEHLMHRFSTPEELFGPISLSKLRQDEYERKIDGYLACARFAFLDEIWKSSPAVLNTLLTLINEHTYYNGNRVLNVPLRSMVVASNEIPLAEDELSALYDRFVMRLAIEPVSTRDDFISLLNDALKNDEVESGHKQKLKDLAVTDEEYASWQKDIVGIPLADALINCISNIREELNLRLKKFKKAEKKLENYDGFSEESPDRNTAVSYISDRRWVQISRILRAAAFFNEEKVSGVKNLIHLEDLLWHDPAEKEIIHDIVVRNIERSLEEGLQDADEGRILSNSKKLDKIISNCANETNFSDHNVVLRLNEENKVFFNLHKDCGFTYITSRDNWNEHQWFKRTDPKDFYTAEVREKCRNPVKDGKTAILLPQAGDIIRIRLVRDISGYFSRGDSNGTEVFTYTVPGMRDNSGKSLETEQYTAPSLILPKSVQLYLKNCREDSFELYAAITEVQNHFGFDKKMKSSIKINFENIFSDKTLMIEHRGADTSMVKSTAPLSREQTAKYLPGDFMKYGEHDKYIATMDNSDEVLIVVPHGSYPPAKGELISYENRYNGSEYVWVEKKCYRDWFRYVVGQKELKNIRHLKCTVNTNKDLFVHGLHCILNDGEIINPEKLNMNLQAVDYDQAVLQLSPEDRTDITVVSIPYDEFVKDKVIKVYDNHGKENGQAVTREAPTGRSIEVRLNDKTVIRSIISNDTISFMKEIIGSMHQVDDMLRENSRLISRINNRLNSHRDYINSDIFLSDRQKHDLTAVLENVYAPVKEEIAKAGLYEQRANDLVKKNKFR